MPQYPNQFFQGAADDVRMQDPQLSNGLIDQMMMLDAQMKKLMKIGALAVKAGEDVSILQPMYEGLAAQIAELQQAAAGQSMMPSRAAAPAAPSIPAPQMPRMR